MSTQAGLLLFLCAFAGDDAGDTDPRKRLPDAERVKIPETNLSFEIVHLRRGMHRPFAIGKHEVTWRIFEHFHYGRRRPDLDGITRPTSSDAFLCQFGAPKEAFFPDRPRVCLRWHGAVAYCDWLSRVTGRYFRPPTEWEWEYAARAGNGAAAPSDLDATAWHTGNSKRNPRAVGGKKANAFGLHDMLGSAWEYCIEQNTPGHFDPVLRGGAWNTPREKMGYSSRRTLTREWWEGDPNRPRSTWWFTGGFNQGLRVVQVSGPADAGERRRYAEKIRIRVKKAVEHKHKTEGATDYFWAVSGTVKNEGARTLDEVELRVFPLTGKGKPHLADTGFGGGTPDRATWSKCWPVLTAARGDAASREPLRTGEERAFSVDVPFSFDDPPDVGPEKFGAQVTNLRFSGR